MTRELRAKVGAGRRRRLYGSRRDAFVAMVQAANLRDFDDPSRRRWLNRPTDGRVLSQPQVRPGLLVVFEVRLQDAAQASFIQDNHPFWLMLDASEFPERGVPVNFRNPQALGILSRDLSI